MQNHTTVSKFRSSFSFLLIVTLILINAAQANAQNKNSNTGSTQPSCQFADTPLPTRVTSVTKEVNEKPNSVSTSGNDANQQSTPNIEEVELGDVITLKASDLEALLKHAKCLKKRVVLYLDDRPLKNAIAYPPNDPNDPTRPVLRFPLKLTEDSRDVWTYILGRPRMEPRLTKVSMGIEDQFALPTDASINFRVIPSVRFLWFLVFCVVILVLFVGLAWKTALLRAPGPLPGEGNRRPFSLARTQAAWWLFLVVGSYGFIFIITGNLVTIPGAVVGLLGVSAVTAVGGAVIDASKSSNPDIQSAKELAAQDIQSELSKLAAAAPKETPEIILNRASKESQVKKLNNESENFLQDILSDVNGVSIHRYQSFVLSLGVGIIFIFQVYVNLAMPLFDESLLAVLGVSAGTFLGVKATENPARDATKPK